MRKLDNGLLKAIFAAFLFSIMLNSFSQDKTEQQLPAVTLGDQVTMKIGGFLRSDLFFDTRKNLESCDGLLDLLPLGKNSDVSGKDINSTTQFRMSAAASRFNFKFTGPDVLNAKTSSLVEFDFTGYNGIGLRLRHAWIRLNWQNSELLFGRYWHPMFIVDAFPTVLALSTGAPFNVFNRTEQIRFTYNVGQLSLMAAASSQMDYGFPTPAYHTSKMPDFTGNVQFKTDLLILGASGNFKLYQPKTSVTSVSGKSYKTDETISSISGEAYAQVKAGSLKVKGSVLYGQNMHELLMLSGYGIKSKDTTGIEKYTPTSTLSSWVNIVYGDKLQGILFLGYAKNLGSSDAIFNPSAPAINYITGRGSDIDHLIRISPSVTYKVGRVQFWLEFEHTIAAYGTKWSDHGKVSNTSNITNDRVQFATMFYF